MTGLVHLGVTSLVSYLIAALMPALDVLVPVLPSETAVIALGVSTAGSTDPRIAVLVALAAAGAFAGDNVAYLLGRRLGPVISRRMFASARGERRLAWARQSLGRYGAGMIIVCRFIPGGRTAVTVACGLIGYPWRRFAVADGCAAVLWALYAFFIGRLGGRAFEDRPWIGLLVALGLTVVLSAAIEGARRLAPRLRRGRGRSAAGGVGTGDRLADRAAGRVGGADAQGHVAAAGHAEVEAEVPAAQ
jgi:membrane-associated protein